MMHDGYSGPLPAGTEVTCENGHRICDTKVAIRPAAVGIPAGQDPRPHGDVIVVKMFHNYAMDQRVPEEASTFDVCVCSSCGAPWIATRPTTLGYLATKIHTNNGWWP